MLIRRQGIRWQTHRQAKIKLEGAENFVNCTLSDISLKGCKLTLLEKLPEDKPFRFELFLSDEFRLDIEAWVAWHKSISSLNYYGIYFTKIKHGDKENIYKFIRRVSPEQINKQWWEGGEIVKEEKFQDRRIFERFPVKLPLEFLGVDAGTEGQAETFDVSAKGIGLTLKQPLPLNTVLEMWLKIPDKGEPLYARGQVVWSKPAGGDLGHRLGINLEKADLMGISRVLRTI